MKSLILALTLSLVSVNAFAISKECQGANNDSNTKGVNFTAQITQQSVGIAGGADTAGNYPFNAKMGTVNGEDGNTYLNYDVDGGDGCNSLLVDENLLKAKGQGWIKFRCRGEGFSDSKYFCK
jgi:hypothetical protein